MGLNKYLEVSSENYVSEEGIGEWIEDIQMKSFDKWWAGLIKGDPVTLRGKLITTVLKISAGYWNSKEEYKHFAQYHVVTDGRRFNGMMKFMSSVLDNIEVLNKYKQNLDKIISSGSSTNYKASYNEYVLTNWRAKIVNFNNKENGYNKILSALPGLKGVGKGSTFSYAKTKDRDFTPEEKKLIDDYASKVGPYVKHFSDLCKKWCTTHVSGPVYY